MKLVVPVLLLLVTEVNGWLIEMNLSSCFQLKDKHKQAIKDKFKVSALYLFVLHCICYELHRICFVLHSQGLSISPSGD